MVREDRNNTRRERKYDLPNEETTPFNGRREEGDDDWRMMVGPGGMSPDEYIGRMDGGYGGLNFGDEE